MTHNQKAILDRWRPHLPQILAAAQDRGMERPFAWPVHDGSLDKVPEVFDGDAVAGYLDDDQREEVCDEWLPPEDERLAEQAWWEHYLSRYPEDEYLLEDVFGGIEASELIGGEQRVKHHD